MGVEKAGVVQVVRSHGGKYFFFVATRVRTEILTWHKMKRGLDSDPFTKKKLYRKTEGKKKCFAADFLALDTDSKRTSISYPKKLLFFSHKLVYGTTKTDFFFKRLYSTSSLCAVPGT